MVRGLGARSAEGINEESRSGFDMTSKMVRGKSEVASTKRYHSLTDYRHVYAGFKPVH